MSDKKLAAQAYCAVAAKLEAANIMLRETNNNVTKIHTELEKLRTQLGKDLKDGESITILLPKNVAIIVTQHKPYTEVEISRIYDDSN